MLRYIIRRLLWIIVLLFLVSGLTFVIFYAFPSTDPAALRAGRSPDPQVIAQIREQLGLNRSLPEQYYLYMKAVFTHFDFGQSYVTNQPVREQIVSRLGASASVAVGAMVVWLMAGIPVGIISAIRRRTWLDRSAMGAALLAISAPPYWLGLVALYLFSKGIGLIPIFPGAGSYVPPGKDLGQWLGFMILPWLTLAAAFAAFYARLLRSNLIETMSEDYIRTARAKGLSERRVVLRHGVRAAITPIVTVLGLDLGVLLGGTILIETVFNIPGVGRLAYDAILRGDLPTVQGTVLFASFFIVLMVLIVDIAYAFLDPRVRYA
jgi:peptide/nickel transport system permease protein